MGTNYYLHEDVCHHCGRSDDLLHIGKSSGGWCFALHVIPEEGLNSLGDWADRLGRVDGESAKIKNEYGDELLPSNMMAIITERKCTGSKDLIWYDSEDDFHRRNHSERGPNGLIRRCVDGEHCIAHGAGTWDLIKGDFS